MIPARHRLATFACLAVAFGALASCGAGKPPPPTVQVSLTAPVDGARVNVSRLAVLGTVSPPGAVVRVSGRRVRVSGGAFRHWIGLRRGLTHIRIVASAPGYVGAILRIAVHNGPRRVAHPRARKRPRRPTRRRAPVPLSAFVNQVNRACTDFEVANTALVFQEAANVTSLDDALRVLRQGEDFALGFARRLREIHAPPARAGAYAAYIATFAGMAAGIDRMIGDLRAHRVSAARRAAGSLVAAGLRSDRQSAALGLTACSGGFAGAR